jgi:hypothetical protein
MSQANNFEHSRYSSVEEQTNAGLDFLKDIQQILTGQENKNRISISNNAAANKAQQKRTGMAPPSEKISIKFRRGNHQPHFAQVHSEKENTSQLQSKSKI